MQLFEKSFKASGFQGALTNFEDVKEFFAKKDKSFSRGIFAFAAVMALGVGTALAGLISYLSNEFLYPIRVRYDKYDKKLIVLPM